MMAKAKRTRKARKAIKTPIAANDSGSTKPTPEREAHNKFQSAGMAVKLVPVIDELRAAKVLNQAEYDALSYYRDQASLADKSPVRSQCDFSVRGGGGHGVGVAIMSANIETGRMERAMMGLWSLARAVCVEDVTLEAWVIAHGGSIQTADGIEAKPFDVGIAALELKYAAGSIVR